MKPTRAIFNKETRNEYLRIIETVIQDGADGIVYVCAEIPILLHDQELKVKAFDTTFIHAKAVVDLQLKNKTTTQRGFDTCILYLKTNTACLLQKQSDSSRTTDAL